MKNRDFINRIWVKANNSSYVDISDYDLFQVSKNEENNLYYVKANVIIGDKNLNEAIHFAKYRNKQDAEKFLGAFMDKYLMYQFGEVIDIEEIYNACKSNKF